MKRSLCIVFFVAGGLGLIAVANGQRPLRYFDPQSGAVAAEHDEQQSRHTGAAEDPRSDIHVTGPGRESFEDDLPLEDLPFNTPNDLEAVQGETIPPGPGIDFRQFETQPEGKPEAFDELSDESAAELAQGPTALPLPQSAAPPEKALEAPELFPADGAEPEASDEVDPGKLQPLVESPAESDTGPVEDAGGFGLFSEAEQADRGESTVAEADGVEPEPPAVPDEAALGLQSPNLALEKVAPATIRMGEPLRYEIVVRNAGSTPAHSVVVRDPVPAGTELIATEPVAEHEQGELLWTLGTLEPQQERRLVVELKPTREGEIGSVAQVTFAARAAARTLVAQPKLTLEVLPDVEQIQLGEAVTLTFRVSNPGTGTATGVVLIEPIPEPLEHPAGAELEYEIGTLEPGQTREVPLTLSAGGGGRAVNQATVVADGGLEARATTTVDVVAPKLGVTVSGPRRRYLGRPASYTVAVVNPGQVPTTGVRVVSYVPEGMQFVEAGAGGRFDPGSSTVSWSLAELAGSQTAHLNVALMPTSPGEKLHRVLATAERGLEAESQVTTAVEGISAVLLEVVDVDDPVEVGTETVYEVRIVSQGSKSSTNVRLTVEVPPGIEFLGSTGPTEGEASDGKVVFEPLERLGPGVDAVYRIRAKGTRAGDQRFKVALTTDQMTNPVREEESTRVYAD